MLIKFQIKYKHWKALHPGTDFFEVKSMLKMQISTMFRGKGFKAAFGISMICAVLFFIIESPMPYGVFNGFYAYCGMGDCNEWAMFSFLLSFLIVLPFATSFQDDLHKRTYGALMIRENRREYIKAKMTATFIGNFIMVVIPFLLNMLLCFIFLSHVTNTPYGEPGSNLFIAIMEGSGADYSSIHPGQPLVGLIKFSPVLYCILYLILLGVFCGLAGVVVLALSFWVRKYKLVLFLPFLLIGQLGETWTGISLNQAIEDRSHVFWNFSLWDYVAPFSYTGKSYVIFWGFVAVLCVFVYVSYRHILKLDYLELME